MKQYCVRSTRHSSFGDVKMILFKDVLFASFFLGVGGYYLLGTLWPERFARGHLQRELQREKRAKERQILRIVSGMAGIGLLIIGVTAIASSMTSNFPLYTFAGIALGLIAIPILVTYFR
jgi:hypothetical protein